MELLRVRARFIRAVRDFFLDRDYLEVDTPALAPALIPEPALEVFRTEWLDPAGPPRSLYLIPSPELWMKRLLAQGSGNLFQICRAFRNGESLGRVHNPEFTILEWYTVDADYRDSVGIMESMLQWVCDRLAVPQGSELRPPFPRMSVHQAVKDLAGIDLAEATSATALAEAATGRGLVPQENEGWDEVFHRILVSLVEPGLPPAVVLMDYPAQVPTTGRSRGATTERWELYLGGIEMANCYTEERDPRRVARFLADEGIRKRNCRVHHPVDEGYASLFAGGRFPLCSGVALGMDRLFMVLSGLKSIESVLPYTFSGFASGGFW